MLNLLERSEYIAAVQAAGDGHWSTYEERWSYHELAVSFVQRVGPKKSSDVLEMGTMGVSIVRDSETVDYSPHWPLEAFRPTYEHDARVTPWPFRNKQYEVFVALRVFHHLAPAQREAFSEAKRIANSIILVVPNVYPENAVAGVDSRPIDLQRFIEWNGGKAPTAYIALKGWLGNFYFWDSAALA